MFERQDNITIFSPDDLEPDARAIQQLKNCMDAGDATAGVLCADHHVGYSQPIGGSIGYEEWLSPTGVGFDIGCGNKAVATSLRYQDIRADLPKIMDEVARRISFGVGRPNDEPVDHPVFDRINRDSPMPGIRNLLGLARKQLGTVGSGNHYVDLFREEGTDRVWIGVHFGSRGFGHKIATGFIALSQGQPFDGHGSEGEMDSPPLLFHQDSPLGHNYLEAMTLAGEYAYAGRDTVVNKVLEILGNPGVFKEVHNHHNFLWRERHGDRDLWVVRKGATPLFPGQEGFVGASMGENAVIIEGYSDYPDRAGFFVESDGAQSLWSAPHGAGRIMSRTEAKGKQRKRSKCNACGYVQAPSTPRFGHQFGPCPKCGVNDSKSMWIQEQKGKIEFKSVKKELAQLGIELRGGDADEAPLAYKRLPAVLAAHDSYVKVTHSLRPIGVAMAGTGTHDPYKD
jgi:tRNA-splicing ligase RtcB